jgi:AAA15 family ATPase/GTPase
MVVDGFKSYAQRTEINGFDPLFNAITGLNGSGKSNILDSICFLLGIVIEGSLATLLTCPKIPQFVKKNQFMKTNWFVYIFASLEASLIFPLT